MGNCMASNGRSHRSRRTAADVVHSPTLKITNNNGRVFSAAAETAAPLLDDAQQEMRGVVELSTSLSSSNSDVYSTAAAKESIDGESTTGTIDPSSSESSIVPPPVLQPVQAEAEDDSLSEKDHSVKILTIAKESISSLAGEEVEVDKGLGIGVPCPVDEKIAFVSDLSKTGGSNRIASGSVDDDAMNEMLEEYNDSSGGGGGDGIQQPWHNALSVGCHASPPSECVSEVDEKEDSDGNGDDALASIKQQLFQVMPIIVSPVKGKGGKPKNVRYGSSDRFGMVDNIKLPVSLRHPISAEDRDFFEQLGLSPPRGPSIENSGEQIVSKIEKDLGRKAWKNGFTMVGGKKEAIFSLEGRAIAVFFYSRRIDNDIPDRMERREVLMRILLDKKARKSLYAVIKSDGDKSFSDQKRAQLMHVAARMQIHRIFTMEKAQGFLPDMRKMILYSRNLERSTCFVTSPALTTCYRVQAYGQDIPPADVDKFLRGKLSATQLISCVLDSKGGDSNVVLGELDRVFFDCPKEARQGHTFHFRTFSHPDRAQPSMDLVKSYLADGPGLISKFRVTESFYTIPGHSGSRSYENGVYLYTDWEKEPTNVIFPKAKEGTEERAAEKNSLKKFLDISNGTEPDLPTRCGVSTQTAIRFQKN